MDEEDFADRLIESVTRFSNTRWDEATKDFTDEPMPTNESDPTVVISALTTKDRLDAITPELLAKRWGVGVELTQRTLKVQHFEAFEITTLPYQSAMTLDYHTWCTQL